MAIRTIERKRIRNESGGRLVWVGSHQRKKNVRGAGRQKGKRTKDKFLSGCEHVK